ncbi:MAG: DEAD/DEAH box helicase family protein [Proteobacteria bacterium]|nr:DEAD/DEAH box helicase family protein [Pseudomonadota bacterium]
MTQHNEDSRVKIPAILHLVRLGYEYLSLREQTWDETTNIFTDIFNKCIKRINPDFTDGDVKRLYDEISLSLENEDLGKVFYEKLTATSGKRIIDFENFDNNTFNVVTELPYKKDDENFRPDIILLINGMPLAFIEVKKPNNKDGVLAEETRIADRIYNKKFRKFVNLTQLMIFSNNMEYDDSSPLPIEGAFYATASYQKPGFNYFREEEKFDLTKILADVPDDIETAILKDTGIVGIKHSPEFITNKNPDSPTNRICTSLFQRKRLSFMLQYGLAYVKDNNGIQKHIMRYPQIFATKAIEKKLEEGVKKGIIWHTQGSGKTALAYYNVKHLTDYFQSKGIIPKFYFIVDRIDLLIQAGREFKSRGLVVHNINSREEFSRDIKSTSVIHNNSGKAEITVVNIQKFEDAPDVIRNNDYNLNIQRIYFLDEVHRSYNPKGSFLANLHQSDANAIKIGLTGTPLLGTDFNSKSLFGGYIHKYYYNSSIADGYTLRLIREEIEINYKLRLQQALEGEKLLKGGTKTSIVYAHPKFVEPMLEYIVQDLENARIAMNDNTIGGMVVCDSSEQAKMMLEIFESNYAMPQEQTLLMAAEPTTTYGTKKKIENKVKSAALILHNIGVKDERKEMIEDFKAGKIDLLFVYQMLQTGFDAPRLKKLYMGRMIKDHNLLQTLTRVNRTYKDFRYGYVVDFAGIQKEFDKTNRAYFEELQDELGDEMQYYSNIFKSTEEITAEIHQIKDVLFKYDTKNAEVFSQQITQISDRKQMLEIVKVLNNARDLYNLIRLSGNYDMLEKLDFHKLTQLSREANNRLALINTKEALENDFDGSNLLNIALEDVLFAFVKVKEEEMILADQLKNILQKTRESLGGNFDPKDPVFVSLREELERLFKKKKLNEVTKEEMEANIRELETIYNASKELERTNQLLKAKYDNDAKYARIHKRLMEKDPLTDSESKLFEALQSLKKEVDAQILQNSKMMENESYVERMMGKMVLEQLLKKHQLQINLDQTNMIQGLMVKEYMNEFYGRVA